MSCSEFPTIQTAKTFKLDAETQNEVVTSDNDRTSPASDGKTKLTLQGIDNLASEQRDNIDQLAEQQRDNLDLTFASQFNYKRIGDISDYAGQSLSEADKLNSYQFPDDSGDWYAPEQGQSFPITIPVDPTAHGSDWFLLASSETYRGLWPDTGGSANKGEMWQTQTSSTPTGQYFTALQNTTIDPVSDDVNWMRVVSGSDVKSFNYNSIQDAIADEASITIGSTISIGQITGGGADYFLVESVTTEGGKDTPDYFMLSASKRSVLAKSESMKFAGIFSSPPELKHRVGQLVYRKKSHTEAELLTDLSRYIPYTIENENDAGIVVAYADFNKGNDNSGDGLSWANAKASIQSALNLNPDLLLIRAGQYNRANRLEDLNITKDLSIISVGGNSQVSMMATGEWSADTRDNVYKLTYASGLTNTTSRVFDDGYLTNKTATVYQEVSSVDEVESTHGSWWHDETNFATYVRAIDDRNLVTFGDGIRLTQNVPQSDITYMGNHRLYMEGVEFWGGSGQVEFRSDGNEYLNSSFYGKRCKFNGNTDGGGNGFAMRDIGVSIAEDCESSSNRRDGFNYHYYLAGATGVEGVSPHFIEINCNAHNNGLGGAEGNNQGSTAHEKSVGMRIGGDYSHHEDGGNVVDIESVNCLMVSNNCCDSSVVGALLSADSTFSIDANWWVDGMLAVRNGQLGNGTGDLAIDGYNSKLHMRDVISDKVVSVRNFSNVVDYSW
ncbi:coil containing protein [Vibrio phage 1.162.O._10N.261.48.E3]|nr:coil containing protein [Vibrio phage 1.147.O._10N.286.49.E9]AUR91694.1 coil containing protein [Vibrio phage 1.162.O._10N.261.48.E3]